jgi:hypothetical protein
LRTLASNRKRTAIGVKLTAKVRYPPLNDSYLTRAAVLDELASGPILQRAIAPAPLGWDSGAMEFFDPG